MSHGYLFFWDLHGCLSHGHSSNAVKQMPHLSANTSRGDAPCAQLFTIHAESMAARKPRAMPVPIGQKGYTKQFFF